MTELRIRIVPSLAEVAPRAWDACAGACGAGPLAPAAKVMDEDNLSAELSTRGQVPNPFISHDFLSSLEQSGSVGGRTGWQPQYLLAEDAEGALLGCAPSYVKSHSRGEYVFDHGWADAFERAGGDYYPKLQVAVPFTPVTGERLLARPGPAADSGTRRARRRARRNHAGERIVLRPRHLPHRSGMARARAARLPATHRPAIPLAERRLRRVRGFPRPPSPRASARPSGASASRRSPPASRCIGSPAAT